MKTNEWRLPTIQELLTLVNYDKHDPACDLENVASGYYWSSSIYTGYTRNAWSVYFVSGNVHYNSKTNSYYAKCVRTLQDGSLEWAKSSTEKMTWEEAMQYAENMNEEKDVSYEENLKKTITLPDGTVIPEPVREPLEDGCRYWTIDFCYESGVDDLWWNNHDDELTYLKDGKIFSTEEDAKAWTDYFLSLMKEK